VAAFPNATIDNPETAIAAGLLVRAGSTSGEYNGFTGNVDKVVVGVNTAGVNAVTTFDFEPVGPSAPTSVVATEDIRSANVTWSAPSNNGGQPLSYTVVSAPIGASCVVTGLTAACTNLIDNGTYTFVVTATNSSGSAPSAASNSMTTPNVPSAPAPVSGVIGSGSVTLTWTTPTNEGGRPVTGYTVTRSPSGATCSPSPATSTSCLITGLTNGTNYTFSVTAQNAVGSSAAATSSTLKPLDVPGQPTAVSATPGNAQATVSWTAPSLVGGSPITSYTVTSSPGGFSCSTGGATPATTCAVTGLINATSYTFTAVAVNTQGPSPASAPSAAVVPFTVPGAPNAVSAAAGTTSATISWTAPASNNGRLITGYTVTGFPGGTCATAATSCTISGLTAGTSYTFTVYATNLAGDGPASSPTAPVQPFTIPTAPQAVSATGGVNRAIVSWSPPASNGGAPVTGYTVTGAPDGGCITTTALTCTITGLTAGTSYTFTVRAINAAGTGPASVAVSSVVSLPPPVLPPNAEPLDFTSVGPRRVFDTRPGESLDALRLVNKTKIGGAYVLEVKMTDLAGLVPATGVGAVSLNITATNPDNTGFITVYACGTRELVSSVNFAKGQTVANAVIAPVSATGTVCLFSNTTVDVIADVNGWFAAGKAFASVGPKRVFDTRSNQSPEALRSVNKSQVPAGQFIEVKMTDLGGFVPASGVGAVSLNVTVTNPAAGGFVTVYSCGAREFVSSVNFTAGSTVANAVMAPVSATGTVCFFTTATTDLIVDINGYLKSPSGFTGVSPKRVLDTRAGQSLNALRSVVKQQVGGAYVLEVKVTDLPGVTPATGVGAVSLNVTATGADAAGFVTVYACGARESVSSVNFLADSTVANAVLSPISASGTICLFSNTPVDLVVDINGWFSDTPTP